jgi:hypothetical protein
MFTEDSLEFCKYFVEGFCDIKELKLTLPNPGSSLNQGNKGVAQGKKGRVLAEVDGRERWLVEIYRMLEKFETGGSRGFENCLG